MSMQESVSDRITSSTWGLWLEAADDQAGELASGTTTLKEISRQTKDEIPVEVVALLAIADLRDIVLELAGAIDELRQ
jgi:hypothetical protein